jgi:hypothetical protein
MATIFPLSASVGQVYEEYEFDGDSWKLKGIKLTGSYITEDNLPTVLLGIDTALDGGTSLTEVVLNVDGGYSE